MNKVYTFNKTTIGHLHIMRKIPCEDYSLSFDNSIYHIAVVADGHGSEECFRSSVGSKIVCETALANLKGFAELIMESETIEEKFYRDMFTNSRYRQIIVKRLTDSIIAEWHNKVNDYHESHPISDEERERLAEKYDEDKVQKIINNIKHIYGTTLMAALALPECLLLIHQGDGRINVIYKDGTVEQPVPWDSRCEDTTTTSMCDADVATSIRHKIINLVEQPVMACYLGCDGVEDAYRDSFEDLGGTHCFMGGVYTFYKDLTCKINESSNKSSLEDFKSYLDKFLPEFSRYGSGDDVSVAGIVDIDCISSVCEQFEIDIKRYKLEEHLFLKENELKGKMRKHDILQKRMKDAKNTLDRLKSESSNIAREERKLVETRSLLVQQIDAERNDRTTFNNLNKRINENTYMRLFARVLGFNSLQEMYDKITHGVNQWESEYKRLLETLDDCDNERQRLQQEYERISTEINTAQKAYDDAKINFEEYDMVFRSIETECQNIRSSLDNI